MTDTAPAPWLAPPTLDSRLAHGRAVRTSIPRRSLSGMPSGDRDPLGILAEQAQDRVPDLIPIRDERMAASPFAFFRGTAALMAADLAQSPHSGILVASCGDAHVANFGFFASPQRTLMFDLNDFDESAWAPWEWDLKRLVTSIVIAGRETNRDDAVVRGAALSAIRTYARTLSSATKRSALERYFTHFDVSAAMNVLDRDSRSALKASIRAAQKRTNERAARKLTTRQADGRLVFVDAPPTMTHVPLDIDRSVHDHVGEYLDSVNVDIRMLMQQYELSDVARRVVGVGSVGTRCYVTIFEDGDANALVLQIKQASRSVLEQYGGIAQPTMLSSLIALRGEGARVVSLQRILQAVSDPFLGHMRNLTLHGRDFYVRQFHDMKGGLDMEALEDVPFREYGEACAATLARAHGQSGTAAKVAGYIGNGKIIADALLAWSYAYADLSGADYRAFLSARENSSSGTA